MNDDLRRELIALLESLEWCGHELFDVCPSCYRDKPNHKDDCPLKLALAKLGANDSLRK